MFDGCHAWIQRNSTTIRWLSEGFSLSRAPLSISQDASLLASCGDSKEWSMRMPDRPDVPTIEQVENADHEQLGRWYRFLPCADTPDQKKICDRIAERFNKLGGMTPALETGKAT
jgi:hypothetical protein